MLDRALLDSLECTATFDWFDSTNDHFNEVCFIANLEPENVVDKFYHVFKKLERNEVIGDVFVTVSTSLSPR